MLLLSSVRFYSVDAIMFVLLEIHPIYPDVVLAPGILINVEIHVEDVVTWKIKKYFPFFPQLKPYIVISPERGLFYKIDLLISTMEIISSEKKNMHFISISNWRCFFRIFRCIFTVFGSFQLAPLQSAEFSK